MLSPYKIAIVEDDPTISQMYRLKFELEGYTVEIAENGEVGLKLAERMRPDIILLDLRMPRMSGEEMLARLRALEWGADMRVVVLTNISKNEAPHALRFLSVDRYIVKAFYTPAQVVGVVEEVLGIN